LRGSVLVAGETFSERVNSKGHSAARARRAGSKLLAAVGGQAG